jgi:hypothetical protein
VLADVDPRRPLIFDCPESTMENLIPLIFSLLLAVLVMLLHRPITRSVGDIILTGSAPVPWPVSLAALTLGVIMFNFQVITLNEFNIQN